MMLGTKLPWHQRGFVGKVTWRLWGKRKFLRRLNSYCNHDDRCTYPFSPDRAGYCWSYAHHVDGTRGYEDMGKICPGCECWKPERKRQD